MINNKLFQATEEPLQIYNGMPIIDLGIQFYYLECNTETEFDFPGYVSSSLQIYNERSGRLLKTIPLTQNGNILTVNSTDTVFEVNGNYFYEVTYLMTGGYEIVIRYGIVTVI